MLPELLGEAEAVTDPEEEIPVAEKIPVVAVPVTESPTVEGVSKITGFESVRYVGK